MANEEKVVEQEPTQEPAKEEETPVEATTETPEEKVETPDPAPDPYFEKNKQLFERTKKAETENKELKAQIKDSQNQPEPSDNYVEDAPNTEVKELKAQLDSITEKQELDTVYAKYPILKDKLEEFDDFRSEHGRMKIENAAKVFLVDNDLLNTPPVRQGLEKPTGGARNAQPSDGKMSAADAEHLMKTDWKKFKKLNDAGQIQISDD